MTSVLFLLFSGFMNIIAWDQFKHKLVFSIAFDVRIPKGIEKIPKEIQRKQ